MLVTTGNDFVMFEIVQYLGLARGIIVRCPKISEGFIGGLKKFAGGNIEEYAKVCELARAAAFNLMVEHALQLGANGIIAMRYESAHFDVDTIEFLAYGTAVKLVKK